VKKNLKNFVMFGKDKLKLKKKAKRLFFLFNKGRKQKKQLVM